MSFLLCTGENGGNSISQGIVTVDRSSTMDRIQPRSELQFPMDRRTGGAADGFIGFFSVSLAASMVRQAVSKAASAGFTGRESGRVWAVERWLVHRLLGTVGNPPIALVLWNGEAIGHAAPKARMKIHDRRTFWQLLANVYLNFGDAFSDGRVEVEGDLLEFLEIVYRSEDAQPRRRPGGSPGRVAAQAAGQHARRLAIEHLSPLRHRRRLLSPLARSGDGLHLRFFPSPEVSLEEAQAAKMELICRKLWLKPGETVVEAGCGWGALALYMARHYGVTVKAYNVSREQIRHARERAKAEGLEARVEFIEDDYRTIRGQFDVFASIGMLEHVGVNHYRQLGEVIHRCLRPAGRGILHTIGRDYPGCLNAWIERRIFPGAYTPSLREIMNVWNRDRSPCWTWRICGCTTP